ncbi:transmembrane protein 170A isoform X2 [Callorhinus ursinus]|uniref:transmembrane protein 170A isoform X2 n=1 Tax=Callorhinus ursinus TaxID=34884 RepID=UPI003CD00855
MEHEGSGGSGGSAGLLQQILSLKLVPRVGNGTLCPNSTSLCSFPDAPGSDWDPKELRKRSPLLVWGEMRLAPEARAGRTAFAARTPNRPGRAEGPNAAIALPWALVSPQRPQVVSRSLSPPSRCTHSASFSF